ncbi:YebC/PmpR family DNA-binding transcriptional regulator, partial [bacterium]|nr:YebC/PmpR family DNA-binding transcriptional regulator [bacterium]
EGAINEESVYEGYGPAGVAVMLEIMTDNKNRTVGDIRHVMSKNGGNLGESGCVAWMFDSKGLILIGKDVMDEDTLMSIVLDAGAEDFKNEPEEENYEILTSMEDFNAVKEALEKQNIPLNHAELSRIPQNYVSLEGKDAEKMIKLIDLLGDNDDVQNVFTNADLPEEMMG